MTTPDIKPGTLCYVASATELRSEARGRVVTARRVHVAGSSSCTEFCMDCTPMLRCVFLQFMFGELWDVSFGDEPGLYIVARKHLRPIAPPGVAEETERDTPKTREVA